MARRIHPRIAEIPRSIDAFDQALRAFGNWSAQVDASSLGTLVDAPGSETTLQSLQLDGQAALFDAGVSLYRDRMAPRCIPGRDILEADDLLAWLEVPTSIRTRLEQGGVAGFAGAAVAGRPRAAHSSSDTCSTGGAPKRSSNSK